MSPVKTMRVHRMYVTTLFSQFWLKYSFFIHLTPLFSISENSLFRLVLISCSDHTLRLSVAVLAFRVAFLIVDVAATSSAGVSGTPRPPAGSSGYPADLSVTDSAAQPIASVPLLHDDATLRTVHRLPRLHESL